MAGMKDLLGDEVFQSASNYFPPFQSHSITSRDAARQIVGRISDLQQRVFDAIRECPSTDEQLVAATGLGPSTLRPRRRELQVLGYIRDSGRTCKTASGRSATIWEKAT